LNNAMTTSQQPTTKQDILLCLLKQGQQTAHELSDRLSITPQAIRRHLKDLEEEGFILHQALQLGMGRPNHVYELSPTGRQQFPDRYGDFAVSLLDSLAATVSKEQMEQILQQQWQQKAQVYRSLVDNGSELQSRVAKIVELRRAEGYIADYYLAEDNVPGTYVLTEYHCAIAQIAESFPVVCGHELEMFQQALPDCHVERTHWLVDGEHRCGYLIRANAIPV
jgi:DeoR family transcriptional regulator, suf operon transcriptional repressor